MIDEATSQQQTPHQEAETSLTTEGQRKINLIWERTQAIIALIVVLATMVIAGLQVIRHDTDQIPTIFSFAFGTIVGFYFSRTNHSSIGGVKNRYSGR